MAVVRGTSGKGETLSDLYAFDVASKTWSDLPAPPPAASTTASSPTLAMVESRLYTFSSGHTHYLDLHKAPFNDKDGNSASGIKPLGPWSPIPSGLHPDKPGPGNRTGATLLPVTTGQGRNYLLLVGGESSTGQSSPSAHSDVWALQLNPEKGTAASVKDSVRTAIKMSTDEDEWAELKYYNTDGVEIKEGQFQNGVGKRKGYAAAKGTEVDGCSVLVWGGFGESGKALGDGLMITVER
ncbi:hypothetical protein H2203_007238 [Taxawa tesnikishii (nom. ined.)]|nr:hypothetical protein H2203_007238 [Dothideales sp. JES 119]